MLTLYAAPADPTAATIARTPEMLRVLTAPRLLHHHPTQQHRAFRLRARFSAQMQQR